MREGMWEAVAMFAAGMLAGALLLSLGIGMGYYNAVPPTTSVEQVDDDA